MIESVKVVSAKPGYIIDIDNPGAAVGHSLPAGDQCPK